MAAFDAKGMTMHESTGSFLSLEFLCGVVGVSILLHLMAAYIKPLIDSTVSRSWSWWRNRSASAAAQDAAIVAKLKHDKFEHLLFLAESSRLRVREAVTLEMTIVICSVGVAFWYVSLHDTLYYVGTLLLCLLALGLIASGLTLNAKNFWFEQILRQVRPTWKRIPDSTP